MNCPRCKSSLRTILYEGIAIETCDQCHGEWLDDSELKRIVKRPDVEFSREKRKAFAESINSHRPELGDEKLVCPKCQGETSPRNYGDDTGIIIDRCGDCGGFWLDKQELEAIQMFVEGVYDLLPDDLRKWSDRLSNVSGDLRKSGEETPTNDSTGNRIRSGISQALAWFR